MSQSRNIKLTVAGLLVVIAVIVGGFVYRVSLPRVMTASEMKINDLYLLDTPRDIGEFSLLDHHGEVFDRERLKGRWPYMGLVFGRSSSRRSRSSGVAQSC